MRFIMRPSFALAAAVLAATGLVVGGLLWLSLPKSAGDSETSSDSEMNAGSGLPAMAHADAARPRGTGTESAAVAQGPGSISGRVILDPSDAKAPNDLVVFLRPSRFQTGSKGTVAREIKVDAAGRFATKGLPLGAYEARAHAAEWEGQPLEVALTESVRHCDITIRAFRRGDLLGFVRDATRAPLEGVQVVIQGTAERGARVVHETTTAADGSFRWDRIEDGNYSVAVGYPNIPLRSPLDFQVRDGKAPTLVLDVPRLSGIDVRVVVSGVDVPVEGFSVTCVRAEASGGGEVATLLTDAEGRASFRNLPPGNYAVRGFREYFKRVSASVRIEVGKVEPVHLEAVPLLDELIQSLNPNPKPDDR